MSKGFLQSSPFDVAPEDLETASQLKEIMDKPEALKSFVSNKKAEAVSEDSDINKKSALLSEIESLKKQIEEIKSKDDKLAFSNEVESIEGEL